MTIELKPEQERIISQAIEAGLIGAAEEIVTVGVETIRQRLESYRSSPEPVAKDLAELFATSPFAGMDMTFERDKGLA